MTAAEFTEMDHPTWAFDFASPRDERARFTDEHVDLFVDDEWCVVEGSAELGELLHIDGEAILGAPIGRILHPDDVGTSPARIWRSGTAAVLKFRYADDGYRRLAVKIRRAANGWLLNLTGLEADVVNLQRAPAVKN